MLPFLNESEDVEILVLKFEVNQIGEGSSFPAPKPVWSKMISSVTENDRADGLSHAHIKSSPNFGEIAA